jgi:hypothetical protein
MKDAWSEDNDHMEHSTEFLPPSSSKARRPDLLNGLTELPDRSTIMSSLPSKNAADKLVANFFDSYNPAIPGQGKLDLCHRTLFLLTGIQLWSISHLSSSRCSNPPRPLCPVADIFQYDNHWTDPKQTTIIWAGMLFAIMCFSLQSYRRNKQEPHEYLGTLATTLELYRIRTAQCIGIADITKPGLSMLRTCYLYAIIEYADERDGDMGTYLLSGTLGRLALQQGYHRDPSQHANISVFEGEMRRRLWKSIVQYDLLACVRIGLPKSLRYAESDTMEPRNLYDDELYEDMEILPPSRPLTEPTQICYSIAKGRIMTCYGRVVEFLHRLAPQPYEEVLRLDMELMRARELIPPRLQLRPLEEMQNDPPSLIMERCFIHQFYHKATCLLHRKYWKSSSADSDGTFFYSLKISLGSAMSLLSQQESMHRACRPGGPLVNM